VYSLRGELRPLSGEAGTGKNNARSCRNEPRMQKLARCVRSKAGIVSAADEGRVYQSISWKKSPSCKHGDVHVKLLQVVLAGQPKLDDRLNQPSRRSIETTTDRTLDLSPIMACTKQLPTSLQI